MGHYTSKCLEKKPKDSSGAQWGLCNDVFVNHSPVEEDLEQASAHHREQLHSEEKNSEVHSEVH